jgi:hypothetical protein
MLLPAQVTRRGTSSAAFRAFLRLVLFSIPWPYVRDPSPPDYMRVVSGVSRGALAMFFPSRKSGFRIPLDCCILAAHRLLGLTRGRASHVRNYPGCNQSHSDIRGSSSSSTTSYASMSMERMHISTRMDHIPLILAHMMLFGFMIQNTTTGQPNIKEHINYKNSPPTGPAHYRAPHKASGRSRPPPPKLKSTLAWS